MHSRFSCDIDVNGSAGVKGDLADIPPFIGELALIGVYGDIGFSDLIL